MLDRDDMGRAEHAEQERGAAGGVIQPAAGQRRRYGRVQRESQPFPGYVGRSHGELMKGHRPDLVPYAEPGGGAEYTVISPGETDLPVDTSQGMSGAQRSNESSADSSALAQSTNSISPPAGRPVVPSVV